MREKRGQITVFIILGIVVLISASFYFYFRTVRTGEFGERTVAPEEIVPVVEYIETCLYDTGSVAVEFLGQQAGYIYLPDHIKLNPFAYLQIVKNSPLKLPYCPLAGPDRPVRAETLRERLTLQRAFAMYFRLRLRGCSGSVTPAAAARFRHASERSRVQFADAQRADLGRRIHKRARRISRTTRSLKI